MNLLCWQDIKTTETTTKVWNTQVGKASGWVPNSGVEWSEQGRGCSRNRSVPFCFLIFAIICHHTHSHSHHHHVVPPFIGIFLTNAAFMGAKKGRWLFPNFSFLSHNCLANSRWTTSSWGNPKKELFSILQSRHSTGMLPYKVRIYGSELSAPAYKNENLSGWHSQKSIIHYVRHTQGQKIRVGCFIFE